MITLTPRSIHLSLPALVLLMYLGGMNACHAQSRYTFSANGTEVTDTQTGLTWRRCYEGMTWSGSTCTGELSLYKHEQALVQAKTQVGWRLPNVKELASLVDTSLPDPLLNGTVFPFPNTTNGVSWGVSWSSTGVSGNAYGVGTNGVIQGYSRDNAFPLRLVR